MRLWPRYPAGHPVTNGRRLEVGLVARQLWFVAKSWRRGYRYGWRSGFVYGPPQSGNVRIYREALPAPLTEERVREIVREEMAHSARCVGRTPGLAGTMKK